MHDHKGRGDVLHPEHRAVACIPLDITPRRTVESKYGRRGSPRRKSRGSKRRSRPRPGPSTRASAALKRQQRGQPYVRTHPFLMVRMLQLGSAVAMCGDTAAYGRINTVMVQELKPGELIEI